MNETQLRELILKAISEAVGDTAGAQSAAPVPRPPARWRAERSATCPP